MSIPAAVQEWLDDFAAAVGSEDFDRGRSLFSARVVGYGTRSDVMLGLETLVEQQWTPIWTRTHGFRFSHVDTVLGSPACWVVAARWRSRSSTEALREGRCTLVLAGAPLRCEHSHFSMTPRDGGQIGPTLDDESGRSNGPSQ